MYRKFNSSDLLLLGHYTPGKNTMQNRIHKILKKLIYYYKRLDLGVAFRYDTVIVIKKEKTKTITNRYEIYLRRIYTEYNIF